MANLFGVLFLLSMIAIVVGVINPEKALFFMPKEKQNKKNAILIFGLIFVLIMVISFVGARITADNTNVVEKEGVEQEKDKKEEPKKVKEVEEVNTFTKEETDYSNKLANQSSEWSELWFDFSELMSNAKVTDEKWTLQIASVLDQIKGIIEEARELNPPEKFEEVNALYMKAVDKYEVAPNELPDAIDNGDENHMLKISESIEEGNSYMNEANELTSELIGNN